jgi:hypothetical protein
VYATIANRLYLTRDSGSTWSLIQTFPKTIATIEVSGSWLYVGPFGDDHVTDSGIWVCTLGCGLPLYKKFQNNATGVIVWSIARDAVTGTLYAGGEIFDHPAPYDPPFFKSTDNGNTWTDISAGLPWHVVRSEVRPADGYLYALLEGPGLYGSPNQGATWLASSTPLGLESRCRSIRRTAAASTPAARNSARSTAASSSRPTPASRSSPAASPGRR